MTAGARKTSPWNDALNMLARREHSKQELSEKLCQKHPELTSSQLEELLAKLITGGLQSDDRYAEIWLRSELSKGRGPKRILFDARRKGISSLVDKLMVEQEIDWFDVAADVACRRFDGASDVNTQARIYRFLEQRGFYGDTIRAVIESLKTRTSNNPA